MLLFFNDYWENSFAFLIVSLFPHARPLVHIYPRTFHSSPHLRFSSNPPTFLPVLIVIAQYLQYNLPNDLQTLPYLVSNPIDIIFDFWEAPISLFHSPTLSLFIQLSRSENRGLVWAGTQNEIGSSITRIQKNRDLRKEGSRLKSTPTGNWGISNAKFSDLRISLNKENR